MFKALFGTQNQKLVKNWSKEHKKILSLLDEIIKDYSIKDIPTLKKNLNELRTVVTNHMMTEDIEFHKLLNDEQRVNKDIKKSVDEFTQTFRDTKILLRDFLRAYTDKEAVYDKNFINTFNTIVKALTDRIEFEEKNLYKVLNDN